MFDTTTTIIIALAGVSVAAFVTGICIYAERFVVKIASPSEERSGRKLIREEVQKKLDKLEADARAFRRRSQEEAWQRVAEFASDLASAAEAAAPSGRAAKAEREHAAS